MLTTGLIGVGRAGGSLALSLSDRGCRIEFLVDPVVTASPLPLPLLPRLSDVSQSVDLVLVCVPDREIATVLGQLADHPRLCRTAVVHLSGAANLAPFERLGDDVFSGRGMLHPLYSFPATPTPLPDGLLYGINGDSDGRRIAQRLVELFAGRQVVIPAAAAPLYHTLAVMVSNFPQALGLALTGMADEVTGDAEDLPELRQGLTELMLQSILKLQTAAPDAELTGPARRGDAPTLHAHLEALAGQDQNLMDLYLRFSQLILDRYRTEIPAEQFDACRRALKEYDQR